MKKTRSLRILRTAILDHFILKLTIVMSHDVYHKSETQLNNPNLILLDFDD